MLLLTLACAPTTTALPPGDPGDALIRGPRVLWEAQVGRLSWRSPMLLDGSQLLVPSNGETWGEGPDPLDGLWVLDAAKGRPLQQLTVPPSEAAKESDVNGVLVTDAGWTVSTDQNGMLSWDRDGKLLWQVFQSADIEFPPTLWESPDGPRILGAPERSRHLSVVDPSLATGTLKPYPPVEGSGVSQLTPARDFEKAFSQVAAGDLNGDGVQDLVVAGRHSHLLIALDGATQTGLWRHESHVYEASPQIVDVDGDGQPEVLSAFGSTVVIADGATGKPKLLYSTPGALNGRVHTFTWWAEAQCLVIPRSRTDANVSCVSLEGEVVWSVPILAQRISSTPTLADVDGDGASEVIVATEGGQVLALDQQGQLLWSWSAPAAIEAPVLAADLTGNGRVELVVASHDGFVRALKTPGLAGGAQ